MINPYTREVNHIFEKLDGVTDRDNICIVVYICLETKNPLTYFTQFFNFLPKDFSCFPLFYKEDLKNMLHNSMVDKWVKLWEDQLQSEYNQIIVFLLFNKERKLFKSVSLEEYSKYRHLVWSRNFGCIFREEQPFVYSTVVPICDLYNFHPEKVNIKWYYNRDVNRFVIEAIKDISKDEEIYLNYGDKSNDDLLFYYGFTIENNPNFIQYRFDFEGETVTLENPIELHNPIIFFRKSKIPHIKNIKHEISALTKFKKHLYSLLSYYNTTLEQDIDKLKELKQSECDFNKMNILTVLIEEKRLIFVYIEFIEKIIGLFKKKTDELKVIIDIMLNYENYDKPISIKYIEVVKYYLSS
jgi:hypothetical protein